MKIFSRLLLGLLLLAAAPAFAGWDGSGNVNRNTGVFTGSSAWQNTRDAGRAIRADDHDTHDQDLADAIENTIAKDGQNTPTANLPMGGFRHTGVGDASARTHYGVVNQIQDGDYLALGSVSGTDTITASASPAISAYATGQLFHFVAAGTNTGATTLNVNSVGAKAVEKLGAALVAGDITLGDVVLVRYDGTQFQMLSPARTPVLTAGSIATAALADDAVTDAKLAIPPPVGMVVDYAGSTAPDGWLLAYGQAVSRTTYSALFAVISTTYGVGDGSTTFNLPDLRGRVVAGQDDMGGTSANRLTDQSGGLNGDTLGDTGGAETHTLTEAEMPSHTHGATSGDLVGRNSGGTTSISGVGDGGSAQARFRQQAATGSAGSDNAHNNVQPTIILNKIIYTGVTS